jgi:hypothetical protein
MRTSGASLLRRAASRTMRRGSPRVFASCRGRSPGHSARALATSAFPVDRSGTCNRAAGAALAADGPVSVTAGTAVTTDGTVALTARGDIAKGARTALPADGAAGDGAAGDGAASRGTSTCPGVPVRGRTAGASVRRHACGAGSGTDSTSTLRIPTSHCRASAGMVAMSAQASFNGRPRILARDRLQRRCTHNWALRSHRRTACARGRLTDAPDRVDSAPHGPGARSRPGRLPTTPGCTTRRAPRAGRAVPERRQPMGLMRNGWR